MPSVLNRGIPAAIVLIFTLDAVDGLVARKYNQTTKLGAILDTVADRIIENTFWIYFTVTGLTPFWLSQHVVLWWATARRVSPKYQYQWVPTRKHVYGTKICD